ncbi:hypothetical protein BKA62DRAFT_626091 [Auriculariales sp. MPI-PUGE-AT-0066]|nr:hypothetical protein BKA62DRAFT_626091 [Auriculariales sp. MPI-PUGE-AT-0066]
MVRRLSADSLQAARVQLSLERRRRSAARLMVICAPNRNGISSCSWHATRNKPNAYHARQAQSGYLNCGCSQNEALFEESLARAGVGSISTGRERLHPDIRRALLATLEKKYGYVDGDFEIDTTGTWVPGQEPDVWETCLRIGSH